MADRHTEIEIKMSAEQVDTQAFLNWCVGRGPKDYTYVSTPDVYYERGENVCRHRMSGNTRGDSVRGAGELTVKQRKSDKSTVNRVEVDLKFADEVQCDDVKAFLEATGWTRAFSIMKDCHIFFFEKTGVEVSVVLYEAARIEPKNGKLVNRRRFLEVEVEKGSKCNTEEARKILADWQRDIKRLFTVGDPVNESLYEIYSGKRYLVRKRRGRSVTKKPRRTHG